MAQIIKCCLGRSEMSRPEFNCEFLVPVLSPKSLVQYVAFATLADSASELSSAALVFYSILSRQPLAAVDVMRSVYGAAVAWLTLLLSTHHGFNDLPSVVPVWLLFKDEFNCQRALKKMYHSKLWLFFFDILETDP